MNNMFFDIIKLFVYFLTVIGISTYLSLYERKLIGWIQLRRGPSYCGYYGILQPIADAIKLFFKHNALSNHSAISIISVVSLFFFSLLQFVFIYFVRSEFSLLYITIFHIVISLFEIVIGISTKSKYSIIGGLRGVFQKIINDIPFLMCILVFSLLNNSLDIYVHNYQSLLFGIIFFFVILINTNHIPFDFLEAESELVAGAFTEYGGILFGMIYLSDYLNVLFNSALLVILCSTISTDTISTSTISTLLLLIKTLIVISCIILCRAILPRFTQKQALSFSWYILCSSIILFYVISLIIKHL